MTQPGSIARLEFVNDNTVINGGVLNGGQAGYATLVKAEGMMKRSSADAGLDMDMDDSDSDSDSLTSAQQLQQGPGSGNGLKPGKKTKGRVKIKMEFIENKLRRYTTFSKRKTGIMKKAYELSTLTGTQVMLLVASETGHVYTFATRKLQPMITSESGKALIQTCLNSPDTPPTAPGQQQAVEQRMNPTGFEETELSYAVGEEEQQKMPDSLVSSKSTSGGYCHVQQPPSQSPSPVSASPSPSLNPTVSSPQQTVSMTYVPNTSSTSTSQSSPKPTNLSMHLPTGSIALLPPGGEAQSILNYMQGLPPGTPISLPVSQSSTGQPQQQQAVYRLPTQQSNQIVSIQGIPQTQPQNLVKTTESTTSSNSSQQQQQQSQQSSQQPLPQHQSQQQQQQSVTMLQGVQGTSQTPVMYHTSQGLVYATAAGTAVGATLPEGIILNLPQTSALQLTQDQQNTGAGQQYITIPVPLPLAQGGSSQPVFQQMLAQATPTTAAADTNRSPVDRTGKR